MATPELKKNAPIDVSETLRQYKQQFLPTKVDKADDLSYDLGNLFCLDGHPLDPEQIKESPKEYLHEATRDNVQLLFNRIFNLPTERDTVGVFAMLPTPNTRLPREKPIPKPKAETAWERYARVKGIEKKKRGKMIFDERTKEWVPRWGYKRGNTDMHDWLIEHKPSETGDYEDPFLKRKADKRERISSQQSREGKNKHRANKKGSSQYEKFLSGGLTEGTKRRMETRDRLQEELDKTRSATASMGKFDRKLANEKAPKRGKQKKAAVATKEGISAERAKNLTIVDRMLSGSEGSLNVNRAAKRGRATVQEEERPRKKGRR